MENLNIIPFEGIGKLKIGMTKDEIREAVGSKADNIPAHSNHGIEFPESDYFQESSIHVTYDPKSNLVDWIGLNDNICFRAIYEDKDVFRTPVAELVSHTKSFGVLDSDDDELGYAYNFPDLGICYWRQSITEDLISEFAEVEDDDREWMLEDIEKSKRFQQVSIFRRGYWSSES